MNISFISSNSIYGGSEILAHNTAIVLSYSHNVIFFSRYDSSRIKETNSNINYINYFQKTKFIKKIKNKILNKSNDLKLNLIKIKPDLVIISQGSPLGSLLEMEICIHLNLRFIVINQLVCDYHWSQLTDNLFLKLQKVYHKAKSIFFVSKQNEELFKVFFGDNFIFKQINNPVSINSNEYLTYPSTDTYKIAFVGRIEFYHKGLDFLIEVLRNPVWNTRNIEFNFYGTGPHEKILLELLERFKLTFCNIKGHTNDLVSLWNENHFAILPSRFEGKSLSLSEAMSVGRGVIATNVVGVQEQIEDNKSGFICPNFTVESLSETLERAWGNRNDWKEIGINARFKFMQNNKILPEKLLSNDIENII